MKIISLERRCSVDLLDLDRQAQPSTTECVSGLLFQGCHQRCRNTLTRLGIAAGADPSKNGDEPVVRIAIGDGEYVPSLGPRPKPADRKHSSLESGMVYRIDQLTRRDVCFEICRILYDDVRHGIFP